MQEIAWDGQQISKPGIYTGVPIEKYHGNLCVGPSISSGGLRTIRTKSRRHYWKDSYLNPNRNPEADKESDALKFGRAVHHLVAGEDAFRERFCIRPDTYPATDGTDKKWTRGASYCAKWEARAAADGLSILSAADMDNIRGMAASLAEHPTIQAGILNGLVERTIIWQDAKTGVWLKARPDVVPTDSNMLVDLKTTADAGAVACRRTIGELAYHMQLGLAHDGLLLVAGREMETHVLVFVEKTDPWCLNIKPLNRLDIVKGRQEIRLALNLFSESLEAMEDCRREGRDLHRAWPGYDDDEVPADLPEWYRKRLDRDAEAGILPALDF